MAVQQKPPNAAVWYFVAATFVFAGPMLFFRDANLPWLPIVALGVGIGLFILGMRSFLRERRWAKENPR